MASIVDKLKKQLVAQEKSTAGVHTIAQAIKALGGEVHGQDIAKAVDNPPNPIHIGDNDEQNDGPLS